MVRTRADFIGMMNETSKGTMVVLLDGNQVYVSEHIDFLKEQHVAALKELVGLLPKAKDFKSIQGMPPEPEPQPAAPTHVPFFEDDDEISF
jgi:hypothetical protein